MAERRLQPVQEPAPKVVAQAQQGLEWAVAVVPEVQRTGQSAELPVAELVEQVQVRGELVAAVAAAVILPAVVVRQALRLLTQLVAAVVVPTIPVVMAQILHLVLQVLLVTQVTAV